MRSIKTFLIITASVSLIIFSSVIIYAQLTLIEQLNLQFNKMQLATLQSIEYDLNNFLDSRIGEFEKIIASSNPKATSEFYSSFEDIYYLDEDNAIAEIVKTSSHSRIFKGYEIIQGGLANFINNDASENASVSAIIRSAESDTVSVYFMRLADGRRCIGRLDIEQINRSLDVFAKAFDSILIISSKDGYILSSTQKDLPFKIIPTEEEQEKALGKEYRMTSLDSKILENNLVLLSPTENIRRVLEGLAWILPSLLGIIVILLIFQFKTIDKKLLKPISGFKSKLMGLDPKNIQEQEDILLGNFKEVSELYSAFYQKTRDLEKTFEEIDAQRILAVEHSIEKEKFASLGSLVAGVAHELNTPIGICITTVSYLSSELEKLYQNLSEGKFSKNQLEKFISNLSDSLEVMADTLDRASTLIQSFKQLAVDQGSNPYVEFNLKQQINLVISSLRHELKIGSHSVNLICEEDILLFGHPNVYQQIFTNLIMNSIIHGFKNISNGSIFISVQKNSDSINILFKDNGCGIPAENKKRIFEPFFTTNRSNGGSGLGLNIVYNLITSTLNGNIRIVDSEEPGVTFEMIIPIL
ncbi:MAG: sensor histidine kinase [Proteocatella sp.]